MSSTAAPHEPSSAAITVNSALWGTGPMALFTHLARTSLFLEAVQEECLAPLGISFGDYAVLRVIEYEDPRGALSPTRLAEIVVRTTGGMTKIIDRLERLGLVKRTPDPVDRRGVLVRLTAKGRRLCDKASDAYIVVRQRLLAQLDEDEIQTIDTALRRLLDVFETDHVRGEQ
jgi:DNA-binding MarR family transcriptional regulator